jgi:hypothetical protein
MTVFEQHMKNSGLELSANDVLPGRDSYSYYWWWQNACIADSGGRL